ncbi:Zn finger-like protein [Pteropox virus]|uniref:Zn finger-like protein n=1 Tax=Pteropox virus TaxID=1873698 RepID=A0A1B1MRI5_9POXV|nr:Zn finger-like protein [Pteropox virus]ANS71198.1 Zn finger-like protein [Pteropox virus]
MSSEQVGIIDESAGYKKKRKRRPPRTTVVEDEDSCTTCSSCHSLLVKVADITKVSLNGLKLAGSGSVLECAACGSALRPLNEFYS